MENSVFEYSNYRKFMTDYYRALPKAGRGELTKTAQALNVQPSLLTGILQGNKNLTTDQAVDWTSHIEMTSLEAKYFLALLQLERAGTQKSKRFYQSQVEEFKAHANIIKSRMPPAAELSDSAKAQFYSEWYYSAIRLMTDIPHLRDPAVMAEKLSLKRSVVMEVLEFLVSNGLVKKENKDYVLAMKSTHVGDNETLVNRHHVNWRLKAIHAMNESKIQNLHFTSSVTISEKDAKLVRKKLLQVLDDVFKTVDASPGEELSCICLDWFNVAR